MMITVARRSISRKFMLAVLTTTFAALAVSAAAMLLLDIHNFRSSWVNDLTAQSDILARASLSALEFNDPRVAQENLDQLKARPGISAAIIYAHDGTPVAVYPHESSASLHVPPMPRANGYSISNEEIAVSKRITRNGETVGAVYLRAHYPLHERIRRYVAILAAVMLAGLVVAALVSTWLQAAVTRPILALTDAVHQVIRRRDFSSRVSKSTDDEVGSLVDAFNSMLAEVGERAHALEQSNLALQREMQVRSDVEEALRNLNSTLEQRIESRTAELERTHEQLQQSQKLEAIGQLTGGVAHDFNNVLQVIMSNLQLLQISLAGNEHAQKRLETATFAANRGAKLSSQLLAFARRQPLQPVSITLGPVLRGMDDLLRRALGESIEVETIVAGGLWTTLVDPHQLENVILNLAINARDAMGGAGKLTLEACNAMLDDQYVSNEHDVPAGQYVMLAVSDNGTGMTPEVLARVFEPFFTTKREGEGTGLGLSMAYGFVKQSQGHIRIYSELGNGTTVKIYLPRCHQPEAVIREPLSGPAIGGIETILVVEDDAAVQATAVDILSGLGYQVLKAHDGQSALNILQSGIPIDLLFTDVVMPGDVRSPDLARHAKQILPDIEVLFTSGYTQNAIVHGGRLDPGVELISKPYRREDLARRVHQILANRRKTSSGVAENGNGKPPKAQATNHVALKVLVVEDNEDSKNMTCELLAAVRHHPRGVSNAEAALRELALHPFDVLLADVNLPGMSGIELAREALERRPGLKIVFVSGYGNILAADIGFDAVSLPKPYNLTGLQQVLMDIGQGLADA